VASIKRYEDDHGPYWKVCWREGGTGRRGHSRQKKFRKKGLAEAKLDKVRDVEARRSSGLPGGDGRWTMRRFWAETFLPLRSATVKTGTWRGWERRWAPKKMAPKPWHLEKAWGDWRLEEITREAVMRWHAQMRKAGASDATVYRAHDLLVNILSFAVEMRYVHTHVALDMAPDYTPARVVDHWRPDTIERLRHYLEQWAGRTAVCWRWRRERDAVLVAVLAYLGLRPGEALALSWRNLLDNHLWVTHTIPGLDEDDETVTIANGRTKTGNERWLPWRMAPFVLELLRAWEQRVGPHTLDSPVFPAREGEDAYWTYNGWTNWRRAVWCKALDGAGIDYRKPYHLRHSAITMWIYAGRPINEVAKRAGHTMAVCMDTYLGAWETYEEDDRFDIEAAFKAGRREARRLRLVA
jgi:integrase